MQILHKNFSCQIEGARAAVDTLECWATLVDEARPVHGIKLAWMFGTSVLKVRHDLCVSKYVRNQGEEAPPPRTQSSLASPEKRTKPHTPSKPPPYLQAPTSQVTSEAAVPSRASVIGDLQGTSDSALSLPQQGPTADTPTLWTKRPKQPK